MTSRIQQIFKWITLLFIGITFYTLTIGQIIPIEFANWKSMHLFYDIVLQGLPIIILLTLMWTIKKREQIRTNIIIGIITLIMAIGMYVFTISLMFSYGFGAWINEQIIYENRINEKITINKQLFDNGAFGYGNQRIVELKPFLGIWNFVKEVDTVKIEKDKWKLVKKEGDIKFP